MEQDQYLRRDVAAVSISSAILMIAIIVALPFLTLNLL
jgi:hypothetical protein